MTFEVWIEKESPKIIWGLRRGFFVRIATPTYEHFLVFKKWLEKEHPRLAASSKNRLLWKRI